MDNRPVVLIADDQQAAVRLMAVSLEPEGFRVVTAHDGSSAIDRVWEVNPDVLLLDVSMPGLSGLDVMRELRQSHPVPIILVTGRDSTSQVREGLDLGADDYVVKPFHPKELAARIRAVLRRRRRMLRGHHTIRDLTVDLEAGRLLRAGRPVDISRKEWLLLERLVGAEGAIVLHDELLDAAFGPSYRGDVALLRMWIGQLRRRLGVPAWDEGPIRTVPGLGYSFDPQGAIPATRSRRPRRPAPAPEQQTTPDPT